MGLQHLTGAYRLFLNSENRWLAYILCCKLADVGPDLILVQHSVAFFPYLHELETL